MSEESEKKVDEVASALEKMTNVYGCQSTLEALAKKMTSMHRTLVQSFISGFVVPFVREMAKMHRNGMVDGRDEESAAACLAMCESIEKRYDIGEGDRLAFPCI